MEYVEKLEKQLKVYQSLHGYTKKATIQAIKELGDSMKISKIDEKEVGILKTMKTELEEALISLENFEN